MGAGVGGGIGGMAINGRLVYGDADAPPPALLEQQMHGAKTVKCTLEV